jgi:hypothetical protein
MARSRRQVRREPPPPEEIVEFREPPPRGVAGRSWIHLLEVVRKRPGTWARIYTADSPEQAQQAQKNLHKRQVKIPMPQGNWEFVSRGCEVFAIYRGGGKRRGSVRRANKVG